MKKKSSGKILHAVDLCSGIGGFREGARISGVGNWNFTRFSEIDSYAIKSYLAAFDADATENLGDIQELVERPEPDADNVETCPPAEIERLQAEVGPCDVLFAGFPCQPHSLMGNRMGVEDHRGDLFFDIAQVIKSTNPSLFILENVRAIKSVNEGQLYTDMVQVLEKELKYNLRIWVLDAKNYGVPQTRRRMFFVGSRGPLPVDPPPSIPLEGCRYPTTWHLLEKDVGDRYYLSERILVTILKDEHKGYYRKAEINKMIARPLTKTMHKMHRASQDNYYNDAYIHGTYDPESKTVIPDESRSGKIRRITPREAFRIQGFSEDFIDRVLGTGISDTRGYMLAGNAVPPQMVAAILKHAVQG